MESNNYTWKNLPDELLNYIFSKLSKNDLSSIRLVNKHLYKISLSYTSTFKPRTYKQLISSYPISKTIQFISTIDFSSLSNLTDAYLIKITNELIKCPLLTSIDLGCSPYITSNSISNLKSLSFKLLKLGLRGNSLPACTYGCSNQNDSLLKYPNERNLDNINFGIFESLTSLDLSWNHISEFMIKSICNLKYIENLNLSNCGSVTDDISDYILNLKKLKTLNLSNTKITDDSIMVLNGLQELISFDISKCDNITDTGMFYLKYFGKLEKLDISNCSCVTDTGIEQLINLNTIKIFYIKNISHLTLTSIKNISKIKSIEILSLRDNDWVDDVTLSAIMNFENLTGLDLRNCQKITDFSIKILSNLKSIKTINLRGCLNITDKGISYLTETVTIEDLDLSYLYHLTDNSIIKISNLPKLTRLILNWCSSVTFSGLESLIYKFKQNNHHLKELSINGINNMQIKLLNEIYNMPLIDKIDYEYCVFENSPNDLLLSVPPLKKISSMGTFTEICQN